MNESFLDEVGRLIGQLSQDDPEPIAYDPNPAAGDVVVGRLDARHRQFLAIVQAANREVKQALDAARQAANAGDLEQARILINRANFLTRKFKNLRDTFYLSVRQAFGLEDEPSVFVGKDWQVGYETQEKMEAEKSAWTEAMAKAKDVTERAIVGAATAAVAAKNGNSLKN